VRVACRKGFYRPPHFVMFPRLCCVTVRMRINLQQNTGPKWGNLQCRRPVPNSIDIRWSLLVTKHADGQCAVTLDVCRSLRNVVLHERTAAGREPRCLALILILLKRAGNKTSLVPSQPSFRRHARALSAVVSAARSCLPLRCVARSVQPNVTKSTVRRFLST
jgi:hypothetical protein